MCNIEIDFKHPRQLKVGSSPWGPEDEIGRLNLMNADSRKKIMSAIDASRPFDLSVEYFIGMPSWAAGNDPTYQIWMTTTPNGHVIDNPMGLPRESNELVGKSGDAISMYTHCGTHLDSLNHFGYRGEIFNHFNDREHLGSRHWMKGGPEKFPPIVARGVLIDVARAKDTEVLPDSYGIGKRDIQEAMELQGVEVRPGDIVMIRTGCMTLWPDQNKYLNTRPGINLEAAEFLVEQGAMMIGADNISLEHLPSAEPGNWHPVHTYLLAEVGVPIIEVMWLEELSKEKIYEVGIMAANMKLRGATGAPLRPIAFPIVK